MGPRRQFGLVFLALVLLAGMAAWRRPVRGATEPRPAVALPASEAAPRVVSAPSPIVSGALAPAAEVMASAAREDARAELARRMKADWCGFGVGEPARQAAAVRALSEAATGLVGQAAVDEVRRTVGGELLEQAGDEAVQRWSRQLRLRRDERAQALADYLDAGDMARARLQARARSSNDPMVTALALQRPCSAAGCVDVEASQWSRLEPANAQAWLPPLRVGAGTAPTEVAYVLERMATQAQYSRTYEREARDMVLALVQIDRPGLRSDAELQRLNGLFAAWVIGSFRPVLNACREDPSRAPTGLAARCEGLGERLWQQNKLLDRSLALAFAGAALPVLPERRAFWESRARELEAVKEWTRGDLQRVVARLMPEGREPAPCTFQDEAWQMLREQSGETDWERARGQMRAAQIDEAALAATWRQREVRSALEQPRRAASAVER